MPGKRKGRLQALLQQKALEQQALLQQKALEQQALLQQKALDQKALDQHQKNTDYKTSMLASLKTIKDFYPNEHKEFVSKLKDILEAVKEDVKNQNCNKTDKLYEKYSESLKEGKETNLFAKNLDVLMILKQSISSRAENIREDSYIQTEDLTYVLSNYIGLIEGQKENFQNLFELYAKCIDPIRREGESYNSTKLSKYYNDFKNKMIDINCIKEKFVIDICTNMQCAILAASEEIVEKILEKILEERLKEKEK